jgi:hypothetical protein
MTKKWGLEILAEVLNYLYNFVVGWTRNYLRIPRNCNSSNLSTFRIK